MSAENDLALAYHMGYDDALAKRRPDASKTQVLAPYDLEAENAALREQVADTCMQLGGAWVRCTELRELVRILAYCMSEDRDCDRCVLNGADMPTPRISACDSLPDRLREAGMEVD